MGSDDVALLVLAEPSAPPSAFVPFRGAFCVPNALPGIPYGDGKRIWTPAFGCYDESWQLRILDQLQRRHYSWLEYLISGFPYRRDYPELEVNIDRTIHDLSLCHDRGVRTIVACRDDQGSDLSYLRDVAAATQDLVDCVMGIYEVNGVFDWNTETVVDVLRQQHDLWPHAVNAFHSTTQDNGGRGFGELSFWQRVAPFVDVYFLQQSAWTRPLGDTANRAQDFIARLQGGMNGWPVLRKGVVLFEETTSMTYRGFPESYGVNTTNALMSLIQPTPAGFMDGGT